MVILRPFAGGAMANFGRPGAIEEWVGKHGVEGLRNAVASRTALHPDNRAAAEQWLKQQEDAKVIAREDEAHEFQRRQTVAAEEASSVAGRSLSTSRIALAVAAVALIAQVWPFIKDLGR